LLPFATVRIVQGIDGTLPLLKKQAGERMADGGSVAGMAAVMGTLCSRESVIHLFCARLHREE